MITVKSTINIAGQTVPQIIPVVQGDTGRSILFTLADFTIPQGSTATYYVQKPSGEAVYNVATIDGNTVLVELTAQSIIEHGDNYGQVRIENDGEIVTSFDFILLVKPFRGIGATQSTTEMNIFDKAVEQAEEAIDDAKDAALDEINQTTGNFAEAFSASKAYSAGEYVMQSGHLYRFTSNHAAGAWTGSDAEAVTVGEELTDVKDGLSDTINALEITFEKNLCVGVQENTRYVAWSDGNTITTSSDASYIGAIIDLDGEEYLSLNQNWVGNSYSFYADAEGKRISRFIDSKTEDSGFVYAVPSNAVRVYLSQNIANVNISRGLVAFEGRNDITGNEYTSTNYPYNTTVADVGVLDNLDVKYSSIKNTEVNIADGTYTAMSNATVSGNTATVTASWSGIRSNEFTVSNDYVIIKTKPVFNVPSVVMRLQAYAGSWSTVSGIEWILSNNTETEVSFKTADYVSNATKYRVIFQNTGMTAGVTNTITIESLVILDATALETQQGYSNDFETLLDGILVKLTSVHNVYHVEKDGTGDFVSFVDAINEATKYMDSVVYVGAGTFDLLEELGSDYIQNPSSTKKGVVLKNRVHVICSSQTILEMNNTGTVFEYLSPINTGVYGCTLENATIIDNGARYSIHDDLGGSGSTPYVNKFINCTMIHKNGKYGDCIGGGLGENGEIEIRGCYFEGDSNIERLAYYHGNNNASVTDAKCRLVVADNYFANVGTFKMTKYGQSTEVSTAYVSNNSFGSAPVVDSGSVAPYDNVAIVQWNNEIRT